MKPSDLMKLPKNLRESYGDLNVSDSLERFDSWLDRREKAKTQNEPYDHTETVREYYDLSTFMEQQTVSFAIPTAEITPVLGRNRLTP